MRLKTLTVLVVLTSGLTVAPALIPAFPGGFELAGTATAASGEVVYVGGVGPGNYSSIQAGVDAVNENGTVYVYPGTYHENLVVNKSVSLVGEETTATVIDGGGSGDVVHVSADRVNITRCTIQNSGHLWTHPDYDAGVELAGAANCSLSDTRIANCTVGMVLAGSPSNAIRRNVVINNHYGLRVYNLSDNNTIAYNIVDTCVDEGIFLVSSKYNVLKNNTVSHSGQGILLENATHNDILAGHVYNNVDGIALCCQSEHNYIYNNNVSSNDVGVRISHASDTTVRANTFYSNGETGILLNNADGTSVFLNNFMANTVQANASGDNIWYNATLQQGNYWDDYTGTDGNGDGIGDTPYNVSGGDNQDLYPLMESWQADSLPPVTTLSLTPAAPNGNQGWYVSPVRATLAAIDTGSGVDVTRYRTNDGSWRSYTGSFVLQDGITTLSYHSVDGAGNQEAIKTRTVRVDTAAPVTTLAAPVNESRWYDSDVTVELDVDDGSPSRVTTYYRFVGETRAFQKYEGALDVTAEGVHHLEYFSRDRAGNAEPLRNLTVQVDKTKPQAEVKTPQASYLYVNGRELIPLDGMDNAAVVIGHVPVEVHAVDDVSGIREAVFSVDDTVKHVDNTTPYTWNWDETLVGAYTIRVAIENGAGDVVNKDIPVVVVNWKT
ncbi:MAG: NosD domain-containing protein [Thermoplasmatota archaeon]